MIAALRNRAAPAQRVDAGQHRHESSSWPDEGSALGNRDGANRVNRGAPR